MANTYMAYSAQLKHPNWQRLRLSMLDAANWRCSMCDAADITLHVHHKRYVKGRMAWEYESYELAVLCEDCHEEEHYIANELKELMVCVDATQSLALLRGFHHMSDSFDPWIGDAGRDRMPTTYAVGYLAQIATSLLPSDMLKVAEFAASLLSSDSSTAKRLADSKHVFEELH